MNLITLDTDDLASPAMLCDELGVARAVLSNWLSRISTFPAPVLTIGPHRFYSRAAVLAWHSARVDDAAARARRRLEAAQRRLEAAQRQLAAAEDSLLRGPSHLG